MNKPRIILVIVLILLASDVFLGINYFSAVKELRQAQTALETQKTNDKVLEFTKLFIGKVLKAQTEVDFETRLKLENAVRNLGDKEILNQWSKFIGSKTEIGVQEEIKDLLEMVVNKIKVQ
ncbi:MAG: hypothetical protein AAB606_00980 [Patescibacteria group bacterium]